MSFVKANKYICYLEITTWVGLSPGATHSYGKLRCDKDSVSLKRRVSKEENSRLKDRFLHTKTTEAFNSEKSLIAKARRVWKKHFPNATHLCLGNSSYIEPHKTLVGPHKKHLNRMYRMAEKAGFYNNQKNNDAIDKLGDLWYELILIPETD